MRPRSEELPIRAADIARTFEVDLQTLVRAARDGRIPSVEISGATYFRPTELVRHCLRKAIAPADRTTARPRPSQATSSPSR